MSAALSAAFSARTMPVLPASRTAPQCDLAFATSTRGDNDVEVNGQELRCLVCGANDFTEMHGAAMVGRGRQGNLVPGQREQGLSRGVPTTAWACNGCGFVHTFVDSAS